MEEILASIRRIISDEDPARDAPAEISPGEADTVGSQPPPVQAAPRPAAAPSAPPQQPEPMPPEAEEIDSMLAQLQATAARRASALAEQADSDFELTEPIEEPDETHGQEHDRRVAQEHRQEQKAPPAFRAATREPDVVLEEIRPQPAAPPHAVAGIRRPAAEPHRSLISPATSAAVDSAFNTLAETVLVQNGRTLEDLVREMLRPMLRAWLDDNLPSMVERLVRAEIERVSRGRG
jgi:cell pole-organizing protein PopZ